jgi:hypothetical protein
VADFRDIPSARATSGYQPPHQFLDAPGAGCALSSLVNEQVGPGESTVPGSDRSVGPAAPAARQ